MSNVVFFDNNRVVTSSRNVAEDFKKGHREVLRSIDNLINNESVQNCTYLFHETTYIHDQNKQEYREYLMTKDGFTLLVMGFTGREANNFKMQYINAFNQMEKQLTQPSNTKLLLQTALQHEERMDSIESDVTSLKNTMRIDTREESQIRNLANRIVVEALGGKKSNAYKVMSRKAFPRFWNEFKRFFELARYGDLPKKQFDDAIEWMNEWQPDTSTRMEIKAANEQIVMDDAQ